MYIPTSFSQYAKEIILSLKSVPSLHDMDVVEYSEYGFKCYFGDVLQAILFFVTRRGTLPLQ